MDEGMGDELGVDGDPGASDDYAEDRVTSWAEIARTGAAVGVVAALAGGILAVAGFGLTGM